MSWQTDWIAATYDPNRHMSPVEVVEARIDEDAEQDNARDGWADGWD